MSIALYQVIIHWQTAMRARQVYKYGRRQIGTSGETGLSRILPL